jgi:hypothetical protein
MKGINKLFNHESSDGTWEILHEKEKKVVHLMYYKLNDIVMTAGIILTYEEFNDLLKFSNSLQKQMKSSVKKKK